MANFLEADRLLARGPTGLTLAVERLLWHLGFVDVRVIDGAYDHGADILAVRGREQWIVQCKWSSRGPVDQTGVDDIERARTRYGADKAVLATNTSLNRKANQRLRELEGVGLKTEVWHGATLAALWERMPAAVPTPYGLRPYQVEAVGAIDADLAANGRALLILATGLGKTVVGGEVIARYLASNPLSPVLVVAHMKELVDQLEKALWRHLDKAIPTQAVHGDARPFGFAGVTVATIDSALTAIQSGYSPGLIMVDETHHVGEVGMFAKLLDARSDSLQFGVTATPWRGDKFDLTSRFGRPSYRLGIAEGMAGGYLSTVDYRMFVDNLDWDVVRTASEHDYSIKDLNSRLFLPQRDEQIIDEFRRAWQETKSPRAILFCQTIEHAERVATLLKLSDPSWQSATYLHSGLSRQKRQVLLNAFRMGRVSIITCVDVFNEGVDVPDVNLIGFLRVTHSRRIFIQQLGRGLRLKAGKESLKVLDFVTDIRRVAATLDLKRSIDRIESEELSLPARSSITFNDETAGSLLNYWIEDAASLETAADDVKLNFPSPIGLD
jgi:superfamily II DNA or RNA helicase